MAALDVSTNLLSTPTSGLMGLAFTILAATQSTPFWETLANGNQLTSPETSFYLTRVRGDPAASEFEFRGGFTLGGTNSRLFAGDIEFLDLMGGIPSF